MNRKTGELIFAVPEKKRPRAAFQALLETANLRLIQPSPDINEGFMADSCRSGDEGDALPEVACINVRCIDALQSMRYKETDVAIVGRDTLAEFNAAARREGRPEVGREVAALPVSQCALKILVDQDDASIMTPQDLSGKIIATTYPETLQAWLDDNNVKDVEVRQVEGKVEGWVKRGMADAACDIVETGSSAARYGLRQTNMVLLESSSVIVVANGRDFNERQRKTVDGYIARMQDAGQRMSIVAQNRVALTARYTPAPSRPMAMH